MIAECADMARAFGVRYKLPIWGTGVVIAASLQPLAVLTEPIRQRRAALTRFRAV